MHGVTGWPFRPPLRKWSALICILFFQIVRAQKSVDVHKTLRIKFSSYFVVSKFRPESKSKFIFQFYFSVRALVNIS